MKLDTIARSGNQLKTTNKVRGHNNKGESPDEPEFVLDDETQLSLGSEFNAAGSFWGSTHDYAKFISHLFNEDEEILEIMTTRQIQVPEWNVSWGLGVGLQETKLGKAFWQWGSESRIKNFLIGFPKEKFGVIICTNGTNGVEVYKKILHGLLGEYPFHIIRK